MVHPSMPTPAPSWVGDLTTSLYTLRVGADRAHLAYTRALTARDQHRTEATLADTEADGVALYSATVLCEGYQRSHYPSVLAQLAFAHQSLATSLSRVWRSATLAYAYGLATTHHDLLRGRTPVRASIRQDRAVPAPPSDDAELTAGYQAALEREYAVSRSTEITGAEAWAGCAMGWQTYAELLDNRVWHQLTTAAAQ